MKTALLLMLFTLTHYAVVLAEEAPATPKGIRLTLEAETDEAIEAFVQKHKDEKISTLRLTLSWTRCTAKGYSQLANFKGVDCIELSGGSPKVWREKDGNYFFDPLPSPESFAENVAEIKSLKTIEVWYGCLKDSQKAIIKKKLPQCEIHEHMNKI